VTPSARPRAALVDLDGTVVSGDRCIDGAIEGIERLRAAGVPVVFLTNRATDSAADHAAVLRAGGIEAAAEDVVTSAAITAIALDPSDGPALVLGDEPLRTALSDAGVDVIEEADAEPTAIETVVVSVDSDLHFARLTLAARAIASGARFVATNPDGARPTPDGIVPETGALSAALTAATGERPTVFGKPNPAAATAALERLRRVESDRFTAGIGPEDCLLVGDNPSTDIELGERVGATTVLVGDRPPSEQVEGDDGSTPTYHIDSLADIGRVLKE